MGRIGAWKMQQIYDEKGQSTDIESGLYLFVPRKRRLSQGGRLLFSQAVIFEYSTSPIQVRTSTAIRQLRTTLSQEAVMIEV